MKKITSLTLGVSFLIMSLSGIILFITPQGKVAYWSGWTLFGLSKEQYGDIHTTSMIVMIVFGILHITYNWSPIVSYLKDSTKKINLISKNFLVALLINIAFVVGTLVEVPPFSAFLAMGDKFKDNWSKKLGEPPYGHAEESSLKDFAKKVGVEFLKAEEILKKAKISYSDSSQKLKEIAKSNGITPNDIYKLLMQDKNQNSHTSEVANLGKKTLLELSDMKLIKLDKSLEYLKSKNLKSVDENSKIKPLAEDLGIMPYELFEILGKL